MDKIMADRFSFTLVLLCIFSAFLANIIHSAQKVLPSEDCPLALASIIGPVEQYQCPFPILNSVLRISISCYLFVLLIAIVVSIKTYSLYSCPARFSSKDGLSWTVAVLSVSHYLCFISIVMDCYVVYTAFKFTRHQMVLDRGYVPSECEVKLCDFSDSESFPSFLIPPNLLIFDLSKFSIFSILTMHGTTGKTR